MYYTTLETYKKKYQNTHIVRKQKGNMRHGKRVYVTVYGKLLA